MNLVFIQEKAISFLQETSLNRVVELGIHTIFTTPLLAAASASDPLFLELRRQDIIGPHHLTPLQWMPEAKSVISYFLPFSLSIREANRREGLPGEEWLYGRVEGEMVNEALRWHLKNEVEKEGVAASIPIFDSRFSVEERRSNYSERHIAFITGLGTFGLHGSLITSRGCAGRFGSILLAEEIEISPRPYVEKDEYCTKCGECIVRCPASAINETGKDALICEAYMEREIRSRFRPRHGCGKCQTYVPCEEKNPAIRS